MLVLHSSPTSHNSSNQDEHGTLRGRAVPATNNRAERDLRPVETQLKISGCHHAASSAKNWLAVRSYLVTTIKHGLSAFNALLRAITGNVWMPPNRHGRLTSPNQDSKP